MTGSQTVAVGRIGPALGLRGEVFVEPWTDDPDRRFVAGMTLLRDDAPGLRIASARVHGKRIAVRFEGVEDRTAAELLRGTVLSLPASARPALEDPDEFYDSDLIGLRADATDGATIGPVLDVLHVAGADYLLIEVEGHERMVPFVSAMVPVVDVAAGRVVIDAPEGLFDL